MKVKFSTNKPLYGSIQLPPSKSIANRVAIILSLADNEKIDLDMQAQMSNDTRVMLENLGKIGVEQQSNRHKFNAHDAGTVYRFMCARLSLVSGYQTLTGSDHMLKRPIKPLVIALRKLGVGVRYLGEEGFPPLKIGDTSGIKKAQRIDLDTSLSSQYASALLMIAPYLPHGLHLHLVGNTVSMSYLKMTVNLMREFGAKITWRGRHIKVEKGHYNSKRYRVESDWSGASYFYAMVALRPNSELLLLGLKKDSPQGDSVLIKWMKKFGVQTKFVEEGAIISNKNQSSQRIKKSASLTFNFLNSPDLAQTIIVLCAALGIPLEAQNLQTLRIKETDRIAALQAELAKVSVQFKEKHTDSTHNANENVCFTLSGKAIWKEKTTFATYNDHRMAMALAPLRLLGEIYFDDAKVVSKSFPTFWEEFEKVINKKED